jgi:hypothetical protein
MLLSSYPYWEKEAGKEHAEATLAVYTDMLEDLPGHVLFEAARMHVARSRFFPTVAELREQCANLLFPRRTALEAWADKQDPIAQKVRRLLPDYNDRGITLQQQSVIRSLFAKYYEQIVDRERQELLMIPSARALRATIAAQRGYRGRAGRFEARKTEICASGASKSGAGRGGG